MTRYMMWRRPAHATLIGALMTLATGVPLHAQTAAARFVDSARTEIDRAVQDMDMDRLDRVGVLLDRALVAFPDDPYALHYRGYLAYRQAVGSMMMGDRTKMGPIIARGLADLAKSAETLHWAETIQLEACMNALRIPLEPGSGMTLGPLTDRLSGEATKLGPSNPRVALLQAYLAQSTPESMGGGAEKAKALVAKALSLFADDRPGPLAPTWGKDEAEALQARLAKRKEHGGST